MVFETVVPTDEILGHMKKVKPVADPERYAQVWAQYVLPLANHYEMNP